MFDPKFVFLHTAANGNPATGVDYDTTAAEIDAWHKARGWKGIGYHYLIRKDGTIEGGRPETEVGAHVAGMNSRALGICFSGHGDIRPHTKEQRATGLRLINELCGRYGISIPDVLGHRELNTLIDRGLLEARYRTYKSCPGSMVDMDEVRAELRGAGPPSSKGEIPMLVYRATRPGDADEVRAAKQLQTCLAELGLYRGGIDGWCGRGTSDAVGRLLGSLMVGDPRRVV